MKQARAFFDSWFEKFSTFDDFVRSLKDKTLSEFGQSAESVIQVEKWFGGIDSPANWERCVKYGVGAPAISRFTNLVEPTVDKTLRILGPSEREKKQLAKMEEERCQAEEVLAQQREAEAHLHLHPP